MLDYGRVVMVHRGDYDPNKNYEELDGVFYNGSTYLVLKNIIGVTPIDDKINYQILAEKGADGATGPKGADGIDAPINTYLKKAGDSMTGSLHMLTNLLKFGTANTSVSIQSSYSNFTTFHGSAGKYCGFLDQANRPIWAATWTADNTGTVDLGASSYKWKDIYASNGVIQTSDKRAKKDISSFDDPFIKKFIMGIKPVSYKFIKGSSNRTHYGMIAQDIEELFTQLNMTSTDFAGFILSKAEDSPDGEKPDFEEVYSLRYEEFISPMIKMIQIQQNEIDTLKSDMELLKKEIAAIKGGI